MDRNDRQAIEDLFKKLAEVERNSPRRDGEAEAFIRDEIARQPGAPYYMAQTIVVQERALAAAERRIEELEGRAENGSSRLGSVPSVSRRPGADAQTGTGGFLAGAAQTALGVAGGWLLGNAIAGMFGSDKAEAAQPASEPESEPEAEATDAGHDDGFDDGDDSFGDFGDFDI